MPQRRREAIKKILTGTATVGALVTTPLIGKSSDPFEDCRCVSPHKGPGAGYFSNAIVQTHDRGKVMFYNDLLAGKIVLVNFMSIESEEYFKTTEKLVPVQQLLGSRLGQDYFIYSITTDPLLDYTQRLKEFAEDHGVRSGWSFITASQEIIFGLKQRFFYRNPSQIKIHGHDKDCSPGLMRYGNEKIGIWGSVPNSSPPEWIVKRLQWIEDRRPNMTVPRRRGPVALVRNKPWLYDSGNYSISSPKHLPK